MALTDHAARSKLPFTVQIPDTRSPAESDVVRPSNDELHVWRVDLRSSDIGSPSILCDAERQRAARFCFDRDRRRFINGRTALRTILARYGRCEAADIEFAYSPRGKPSAPATGVEFNVSHSGEMCLVGVRRCGRIGIDVEEIRDFADMAAVAGICLSPNERATLAGLPPHAQTVALLNGWTRKEAYLKAIGCGITTALTTIEVTLAPDSPPRLLADPNRPGEDPAGWTFLQLPLDPVHLGVVVAEGTISTVRLLDIDSSKSDKIATK